MKILHTADWHIGQFKGPIVDGVNLRSQDRGIKRFITGWLERSQNSMPASRTPQAPVATKNMSTDQYMEATAGWREGMGD